MEDTRLHPDLSEREQQLITLASEGLTDTAIANRLGISEPTVKSYWQRVRSKLGPYNRTELVAHALKEEGAIVVAELNGEIQRLRRALDGSDKSALDLQREMLENAPDAVFAIDQDGCFVWMNLEAEQMFGFRFDELVGKPVSTLVPPELQERHKVHMNQYYRNPERKHMGDHLATVAVRKDGVVIPIAASLAPIETPNGRLVTCFIRQVQEASALASYAERHGATLPSE
jgi:PAS domain S-box-containing protein